MFARNLLVCIFSLVATVAMGMEYVVSPEGGGDFATIQAAIDDVSNGDVISLADGTFTGAGNWDLNYSGKAITIRSQNNDATLCIIDCNEDGKMHRGFIFDSGEDGASILSGVTIINGKAARKGIRGAEYCGGGVVLASGSSPKFIDCIFASCSASEDGGAVYCKDGASPIFENCQFIENSSVNLGGGVMALDSSPELNGSTFQGNQSMSRMGGGLASYGNSSTTIMNCEFLENEAGSYPYDGAYFGGGVYLFNGGDEAPSPVIIGCEFIGNKAGNGGGIYTGNVSLLIASCTFDGNEAWRSDPWLVGGGLTVFAPIVPRVVNCTFVGNKVINGLTGGSGISISANQLALEVENTIIVDGFGGPAVECDSGGFTFTNSDIYGNSGGDWVGCINGQDLINDNISEDPGYSGNYQPENSNLSGLGAWGVSGATPVALFAATPQSGPAPMNVRFFDISHGDPIGWDWDFGDAFGGSTNQNPFYDYTSAGLFTVTLEVDPGLDSVSKVIEVYGSDSGEMYAACWPVWRESSGPFEKAGMTVGVQDQDGNAVADALVTVRYWGPTEGIITESTNSLQGLASFVTSKVKNPVGIWCFEVLDIVHPDYSWGQAAGDLERCEGEDSLKAGDQVAAYKLEQNFPDPFNPLTEIKFQLPIATSVDLSVYSIRGERVATLASGTLEAGHHRVRWDARNFASGVYFYRLEAGSFSDTQKMVLLK